MVINQPEIRTIQEVDAEILALELRLSELRSERNTFLPIHKIPPEVFSHIFCLAAFSRNPKTEGDYRAKVTSVSRYWRSVAIGCPILWTVIDGAHPEWVGLCLERSQDFPLEVDNYNADFNKPWPMALSPCISRARTLELRGFRPGTGVSSDLEQSGWARPAPQLRTLDVRTSKLPQWLFARSAPLLQKLTLQSSQQDWKVISSSFRGLTALKLTQPEAQVPLYDVLVGIAGMPFLADLELDRVIAPATQTPQLPSQGTDRLSPFKTLNLMSNDQESPIPVYAYLLNGLENRINDQTNIDVKIYNGDIQSQIFHLSRALAQRSWDSPRGITEIHVELTYSKGYSCQFCIDQLYPSPYPNKPPIISLIVNLATKDRDLWTQTMVTEMNDCLNHLRKLHIGHFRETWPDDILALFRQLPNLEDLMIPCRNSFTLLDYPRTEGAATIERAYPFPVLKTLNLIDCEWLLVQRNHALRRVLKGRERVGIRLKTLILMDTFDWADGVEDLADTILVR